MPLSKEQLFSHLKAINEAGAASLASYNAEFEETKEWLDGVLLYLTTSKNIAESSVLLPKTPAAVVSAKHGNPSTGRKLLYESDSDESEVTSTTNELSHSKKIKIETISFEESDFHETSLGESNFVDLSNNNKTVQHCIPQESVKTYGKKGPIPKKSIGANSTYVKEGQNSKESIGANITYVKEGPNSKESIGANSTYVKDGPNPKESIGANSTYVKEGQNPKESIGANSTYVVVQPNSKESIGANSTYVLQKSGNEKITCNESNASDEASCASSNLSILEASRIAVEEAMKGPVRLTRNKAKAVAQQAAEQAQLDASIITNKSGNGTALRQARKSINRAKAVAISKPSDCNRGKIVCSGAHSKTGMGCKKPVVAGRLRCGNGESTSTHATINKHLGVSKMQSTLSHNDVKGIHVSTGSKKGPPSKRAPVTAKKQGDRLEELAAKTLAVCQRKEDLAKKKSDERAKKLQDKADQKALIRAEREKVVLKEKDTKAKEPKNMPQTTIIPSKKVIQDDPNKTKFLHNVTVQGHSFLAKPLHLRVPDQPSATLKAHLPVLKPQDLPVHQTFEVASYDISMDPGERSPLPSKNENDYGLDDVCTDDSSDEEENPKKVLPKWAVASTRAEELHLQYEILHSQMFTFFNSKKCTPDLEKIFKDVDKRLLTRRSSAVWHSPESKKVTKKNN